MNNASSQIAEQILVNSINLFRLTANEQREAIRILERMKYDLTAKLANERLTDFGKARINKLLRESKVVIEEYYRNINVSLEATLSGVAAHEASVTTQSMVTVGIDATLPTQAMLKSVVRDSLILGSPALDWWSRQADKLAFDFAAQVRQGVVQGETNAQIIRRISPILDTSKRGASALVHTSIQAIANDSRLATFQANAHLLNGIMQLSTLDSHTSNICIAYSGAQWDVEGHPINGTTLAFNGGPPRHFNCRSVIVPIVKSLSELAGVKVPEPVPGERASDEGPISAKITFEGFLNRKSVEYQDELLGKGRAKLWRDGKITLRDLVSQQGRPLTLAQLKQKYI